MNWNVDKHIYREFIKTKNHKTFLTYFLYFLIFVFCSMTDRLKDKVNKIINTQWFRESSQKNQLSILNISLETHRLAEGLTDKIKYRVAKLLTNLKIQEILNHEQHSSTSFLK